MRLLRALRLQAQLCAELGSPLYADLLARVAADVEAGGACARLLAGHEDDPGPSALALRLLGSVHGLVLEGSAPELAQFYPSTDGRWDGEAGWRAFEQTVREQPDAVRARLDRPPQTNEVGRAAVLMGGLLHVGQRHRLPVRLREIGASGGVNLRPDWFGYSDEHGRRRGRSDSPVQLDGAWRGRRPPDAEVEVVDRVGCDVDPVDVSTEQGRLRLLSYVWPDQAERLRRLSNAVELAVQVAAQAPVELRAQSARDFVAGLELAEGATTVLWHSVVWQYLPAVEQDAVRDRLEVLGAAATAGAPLAHLSFEPARRRPGAEHEFLVVLRSWPTGTRELLGAAAPHGVPVRWE